MRHKMISILGTSYEESTPEYVTFAENLGTELAKSNFGVICDGGSGISESVCRSLYNTDCSSPIVALVNGSDITCHNSYCSVVIPTGQEWGGDRLVANGGDVVVIIGGNITAVGLLDFLCNYSDKQVLVVAPFSQMLEQYVKEHSSNEHVTCVKTVDEIMWYLEVMTEDFTFLPQKKDNQALSLDIQTRSTMT